MTIPGTEPVVRDAHGDPARAPGHARSRRVRGSRTRSGRRCRRTGSTSRSTASGRHRSNCCSSTRPTPPSRCSDRARPGGEPHDLPLLARLRTGLAPRLLLRLSRRRPDTICTGAATASSNKVLIDPYARGITHGALGSRRGLRPGRQRRDRRCAASVVDTGDYDWEGDQPLNRPMSETIIYEMHVGGFTRSPTPASQQPGTFARRHREDSLSASRSASRRSSCCPSSSSTQPRVGGTNPVDRRAAAQLLGLQHRRLLRPAQRLLRRAGRRRRMSTNSATWSRRCHRAGIEVILDVVFNHTERGQPPGPDDQLQAARQHASTTTSMPQDRAVLHGLLRLRQHGQLQPPDRRRS